MSRLPSLFVSHGAPTFALEPGLAGPQLAALGRALGKPQAIVVVSPHWMTPRRASQRRCAARDDPRLRRLPSGAVPARVPGARRAGARAHASGRCCARRHGRLRWTSAVAWTTAPGCRCCTCTRTPTCRWFRSRCRRGWTRDGLGARAARSAPLAEEGVLVSARAASRTTCTSSGRATAGGGLCARVLPPGSGRRVRRGRRRAGCCDALERGAACERAHPTTEHFLPLLVARVRRARAAGDRAGRRHPHGVLAMESYVFGRELALEGSEAPA